MHGRYSPWKMLFGVLLVISGTKAVAGGIQIHEQSAAAMSMGGGFVSIASNPSAIYFNPGGLSFQEGTKFLLGTTIAVSRPTFRRAFPDQVDTKMENNVFFPSYFYIAHTFESGLGVGFGLYNPFGLRTEWPDAWAGRFLATKADVTTFYLNPTFSYKVAETLAIGAGLDYVLGSAELERRIDLSPEEGRVKLEGDGNAVTFNIGFLFRPSARWSFGASWRSRATLDIDGTGTFSAVPDSLLSQFPGGDATVDLKLPNNLTSGIAYSPNEDWVFTVEYQWVDWSIVDSLSIDFKTTTTRQKDIPIIQKWSDGWTLRVGGEHRLSNIWKIRAGYFFNSVPSVDEYLSPLVPEADRMGFNLGLGYKVSEDLTIDIAYLYVRSNERTIESSKLESPPAVQFNGTYNSTASMFALNLGYSL